MRSRFSQASMRSWSGVSRLPSGADGALGSSGALGAGGAGARRSGAHAASTARSMSGVGRARMAGRREQAACRSAGTLERRQAHGARVLLERPSGDGAAKNGRLALMKRMF